MDWQNKVTVVTGGASGIGAACCRNFAARGAKVVVADLNAEGAKAVAAEFGGLGVGCDVGKEDEINALVKAAEDHFGPIDVMFNNAGINSGREILNTPLQVWEDQWNVNVMAHVYAVRAVLPGMRARKYGRIVNLIGMFGREPAKQALPASAVNAAFMAINKGMSQIYGGDGIFVNAVDPGPTRSQRILNLFENMAKVNNTTPEELENGFRQQIPIGRLGEMDEVARVVTFLASDASGNVNGTVLAVDGGMSKGLF